MLPQSLTTHRLLLRAPQPADGRKIFDAYTQSAEVAHYMVWRPHTAVSQTQAFIAECIVLFGEGTRRPYVLALHDAPDAPIGMLEARDCGHTVDVGYVLAPAYWGRGLMPEAVDALAAAALATPVFFRLQATCDVNNRNSARVLEKAGFKLEGRLERFVVHPNISPEPGPSYMYARCR
jgi:[ribosomal protein S5]-alanine N-acetyltransferase